MDIGRFGIKTMSSETDGHGTIHTVSMFYIRHLVPTGRTGMMPPARASVHCFFFLQRGSVDVDVAERRIEVSEGECLIIPMGQVFSIIRFSPDAEGYMGGFHSDFLIQAATEQRPLAYIYGWMSSPVSFGEKRKYIDSIFERIFTEWTCAERNLSIIQSYLNTLLAEMNGCRCGNKSEHNAAGSITGNFLQIISESGSPRPSVEQCARTLNITPGHLAKCVKQTTGKAPIKWIEESVMTEAKMMLYQTDMQIGEIAGKLGIEDTSYFSRMFRRCQGMSPYDFRKMIKKS